jgi:hypothetical protein
LSEPIWIIGLGAVVAGFVQGLSGFAFGLVAMSFWVWTIEPRLAAVLVVFGALTGQIIGVVSVRRGFALQHQTAKTVPRMALKRWVSSDGRMATPIGIPTTPPRRNGKRS